MYIFFALHSVFGKLFISNVGNIALKCFWNNLKRIFMPVFRWIIKAISHHSLAWNGENKYKLEKRILITSLKYFNWHEIRICLFMKFKWSTPILIWTPFTKWQYIWLYLNWMVFLRCISNEYKGESFWWLKIH